MQEKAERQSDHYKKQTLLDKEAMLLGFSFSGDGALIWMALKSIYDFKKKRSTFISLTVLCVQLTLCAQIGFKDFIGSPILDYKYLDVLCAALCLVTQSCPTLCNPWTVARQAPLSMGILQERILDWVAMPSSRRSSQLRDRTQVSHIAGIFFTT